MDFKMAMINWKNVMRMAVGLPKQYPVKIVRTEEAKRYPLIGIKKQGDVGYDLPSVENVVIPAATPEQIRLYENTMEWIDAVSNGGAVSHSSIEEQRERALSFLPKAMIPTGIKIEMPNNVWCSIEARSSASSKVLITPDAIIDSGYRGELFAVVYNFGYEDYRVKPGDRIAQIIFHERVVAKMIETDKLGKSERGSTGFGSTGG